MTVSRIRARTPADLDELVDLVGKVHEGDRYPIHTPDGGFHSFIAEPPSVAAWVAVDDGGALTGHVALNSETSRPAMKLVDAHGDHRSAIYISRLFVHPGHRGTGVGRALLEHARCAAVELGHLPALDVVDIPTAAQAIALYQRAGWTEIGTVSFNLVDLALTERVFVYVDGGVS